MLWEKQANHDKTKDTKWSSTQCSLSPYKFGLISIYKSLSKIFLKNLSNHVFEKRGALTGQDFVILQYLSTAILLKESKTIQVFFGWGVSLG